MPMTEGENEQGELITLPAGAQLTSSRRTALTGLAELSETCRTALTTFATLSRCLASAPSAPVDILGKDMASLQRLIHTSTTRLSVSLGKPPPSYPVALGPLADLTSHVNQLAACAPAFPSPALRKEMVWAASETIQALGTLAQHFECRCRQGDVGDAYLALTGAVHEAVEKAGQMSGGETEAVAKAWRINGESLEDSLREVREMLENAEGGADEDDFDDGWDELGEGFGGKLRPEEMERVKKVYPFLRLTTLLHERIRSHHILESPSHTVPHLTRLLHLSDALPSATDDLASALYAPQDIDSIQEAADAVHQITDDLDRALSAVEAKSPEEAAQEAIDGLCLQDSAVDKKSSREKWFKQCFAQINLIHNGLHFNS